MVRGSDSATSIGRSSDLKLHHSVALAGKVLKATACMAAAPTDGDFTAIPTDPKSLRKAVDAFASAITTHTNLH
jgi:hypothetical protein